MTAHGGVMLDVRGGRLGRTGEVNRPDLVVAAKAPDTFVRAPSLDHSPEEEAEGAGVGEAGIKIVWPACNFNGLSMWLYFCKSLTVTPCILAMEVSVSPRATTCALPLAGLVADSAGAGVPVDVAGAPSPIMTPGRVLA